MGPLLIKPAAMMLSYTGADSLLSTMAAESMIMLYDLPSNAMQFLTWPTQGSGTLGPARTKSFRHINAGG
jgi:hypothetical protein